MQDAPGGHDCRTLIDLARRLRARDGCPWDREQTLRTLTPYLLEETHEVLEAIESGQARRLKEELGDLLFLILFMTVITEEAGSFALGDVVEGAARKIRERHPHVFRDPKPLDQAAAHAQWERIKRTQRSPAGGALLRAGADRLPSLLHAFRIQEKAASFGFDWEGPEPIVRKIEEELEEVRRGVGRDDAGVEAGREIGDLLFSVVNLARHLRQDPERALRGTIGRFCIRFELMGSLLRADGLRIEDTGLDLLDTYWERAKTLTQPADAPGRAEDP